VCVCAFVSVFDNVVYRETLCSYVEPEQLSIYLTTLLSGRQRLLCQARQTSNSVSGMSLCGE